MSEIIPLDNNKKITSAAVLPFDPKYYTHPSDRSALKALEAIPGFHQLMKAIMKVWDERMSRLKNMSSMIRINEYQLPEYYNLLFPICEKLGIEVPELYLHLNVFPDSYTGGDTKPYIVVTSGLFETIPEELIPTVLAHECGHIACHHVLYSRIANIIKDRTFNVIQQYIPFGGYATIPLQAGFMRWYRCSELSADRAAVLCDGTSEKTFELCMRFAGYDRDVKGTFNRKEFLLQAKEYRDMINSSTWDTTLETILLMNESHPLSVVRALEAIEFEKSEIFDRILDGTIEEFYKPVEVYETAPDVKEAPEKKERVKFEFPKLGKKKVTESSDDSVADEIRKYKELFDEGILTEEEFAAAKRKILGII